MKKIIKNGIFSLIMLMGAVLAVSGSCGQETYTITLLTDVDGSEEILLCNAREYRELSTRVRLETSLLSSAHNVAEKQWKAAGNEGRYGGRVFKARKMRRLGSSTDHVKARELLEQFRKSTRLGNSNAPGIPPKPKIKSSNQPKRKGRKGHRPVNPGITEAQWKNIVKEAQEEIELYHKTHGYFRDAMNQLVEEREAGLAFALEPLK